MVHRFFLDPLVAWSGLPEPAIRLVITLFSGYPFAIIYRRFFYNKQSVTAQYLYFIACGLFLIIFNFGSDVYHSMLSILVAYCLCRFLGGTVLSVVLAYAIFMTHLVMGYYLTCTDDYDILWTLPQCILTLRVIGLVLDVYDGAQKPETLSADQKETALKEHPGLIETAAYVYFYGSFLVGPQYPLTRFRRFVNAEFVDPRNPSNPDPDGPPMRIHWTLFRLGMGLVYMAVHQLFLLAIPTETFLEPTFREYNFLWRCVMIMIWVRVTLCRYQAVWCVTEGVCILSGLAYNGVDQNGKIWWDGVRNIRLRKFEFGSTFQSVVESFNYNTNQWAAKYLFKRLRFLGNKMMSHVITLMFLAIWHGVYSGYFACFAYEFLCIIAERQAADIVQRLPKVERILKMPSLWPLVWTVRKSLVTFGCAYGLLPFITLTFPRWWQIYKDLYFSGWIALGFVWPVTYFILSRTLPRKGSKKVE